MKYVSAATAPPTKTGDVKLYDAEAFAGMRAAGRIAASCLDMLVEHAKEGMTTLDLDRLARPFDLDHGALPACVFYRGDNH